MARQAKIETIPIAPSAVLATMIILIMSLVLNFLGTINIALFATLVFLTSGFIFNLIAAEKNILKTALIGTIGVVAGLLIFNTVTSGLGTFDYLLAGYGANVYLGIVMFTIGSIIALGFKFKLSRR